MNRLLQRVLLLFLGTVTAFVRSGEAPPVCSEIDIRLEPCRVVSNGTRAALLKIYDSTNGPQWKTPWDITASVSEWAGVCCFLQTGIWLELSLMGMSGTLPPVFAAIPSLMYFIADYNHISGTLPDTFPNSLKVFSVSRNRLSGAVPSFKGSPNLVALYLDGNHFTGTAPSFSHMLSLKVLNLGQNHLHGPIPRYNLPQLEELSLGDNDFAGRFPMVDALTNLQRLDLEYNQLTGSIIVENNLDKLRQLTHLSLTGNRFRGQLPTFDSWADKNVVEVLRLGSNAELGGTLHPFLALRYLQQLELSSTLVSGSIPSTFGSKMERLDLSRNNLHGTIPTFRGLDYLQVLDLTGNQLRGTIPDFSLPQLQRLYLTSNGLNGSIPQLQQATNLTYLRLRSNALTGSLPSFSWLPELFQLDVAYNQLSGLVTLPLSIQYALLEGNRFSGPHLSFLDDLQQLRYFDGSNNSWHGTLPQQPRPLLEWFICESCGLTGSIPDSWANSEALHYLLLSNNSLTLPLPPFRSLFQLDLSHNALNDSFIDAISPLWQQIGTGLWEPSSLVSLDLSYNHLFGQLHPQLFAEAGVSSDIFLNIRNLILADNPRLTGRLPHVFRSTLPLTTLDLSNTNVHGAVPPEYDRFALLQVRVPVNCGVLIRYVQNLLLNGTRMRDDQAQSLPFSSFIIRDPTYNILLTSTHTRCPALQTTRSGRVTLSPSYYGYKLCACDASYFGIDDRCQRCEQACDCPGGPVVKGCYLDHANGTLVPCVPNSRGEVRCNPNNLTWPRFSDPLASLAASGWCATGYDGRLCSQCTLNSTHSYYSVGRDCKLCGGAAWQIGVVAAYGFLFLLLVAILSYQSGRSAHKRSSATFSILLFHLQQLGLLLTTEGSFSEAFASFISITSGAAGASPQTSLALECLPIGTVGPFHRVIAALILPAFFWLLLIVVFFCGQFCAGREGPSEAVYRAGSVVLALLNIVLLPSAQTSFNLLACIDERGTSSKRYLNQLPYVECDGGDYAMTFAVATISAVMCCVFAAGALLLAALMCKQPGLFRRKGNSILVRHIAGTFHKATSWWFAVNLLRRIALVIVIAFTPYWSPYLPLSLFIIIQLSALLQHLVKPYSFHWDNRAEIMSLYLLLINYFSSLVRSTFAGDDGVDGALTWWFNGLLIVNAAFIFFLAVRVVVGLVPESCPVRCRMCCLSCQQCCFPQAELNMSANNDNDNVHEWEIVDSDLHMRPVIVGDARSETSESTATLEPPRPPAAESDDKKTPLLSAAHEDADRPPGLLPSWSQYLSRPGDVRV